MGILDDVLGPSPSMLGPDGVKGTAAMQGQPQPKKKVQPTPPTPQVAKPAPDPLDEQLARVGSAPTTPAVDPLDEQLARVSSGSSALVQHLHEAQKSGHLATEMAAKSATDPERFSADRTGSPLDAALTSATQGGETALSGIPGGAMALAGLRHLTTGESYHDAQAEQAKEIRQYEKENPVASLALKTLAAAPLAARLPGGIVSGGATYGATANALDPNLDESVGQRLWNTGVGGVEGALTGKLLQTGGRFVQKLGAATGATDAISSALDRAANSSLGQKLGLGGAADVAQAFGTKGAVNQVAADRQALMGAAGAEGSGADRMLQHIADTKAQAAELYGAVKDTPEVQTVAQKWLQDPDIAETINAAAAEKGLPANTTDPSVLHLAKQLARKTVNRSFVVDAPIPRETALRVGPKLDAFTEDLHAASPEIKAADNFYAQAMSAEDAFKNAYQGVKTATGSPSAKALAKTTPEAVTSKLDAALTRPSAVQQAMQEGSQAGASASIGDKIRGVPLTEGTRGVLDLPILRASEAGASGRALLAPEQRAALEATLRQLDQRSAQRSASMAPRGKIGTIFHGPAQYNYLGQPSAVGPLRETANAMQNGSLDLAPFQRGRQTLQQLQDAIRALTVARAGQMVAP